MVELFKRGYSDKEVAQIIGLNILRVMRDVEKVALELQKTEQPSEARMGELDAEPDPEPVVD